MIASGVSTEIMRGVALGMADGHIEQADRALLAHAEGRRPPRQSGPKGARNSYLTRSYLVVALQHMRSAAEWLKRAV